MNIGGFLPTILGAVCGATGGNYSPFPDLIDNSLPAWAVPRRWPYRQSYRAAQRLARKRSKARQR